MYKSTYLYNQLFSKLVLPPISSHDCVCMGDTLYTFGSFEGMLFYANNSRYYDHYHNNCHCNVQNRGEKTVYTPFLYFPQIYHQVRSLINCICLYRNLVENPSIHYYDPGVMLSTPLSLIPSDPTQYGYTFVNSKVQFFNVPSLRYSHQCFKYHNHILLVGGQVEVFFIVC